MAGLDDETQANQELADELNMDEAERQVWLQQAQIRVDDGLKLPNIVILPGKMFSTSCI